MRIIFRCTGFTCGPQMSEEVTELAARIENTAPQSKISLSLKFDGSYYTCVVEVVMKRGLICATSTDLELSRALKKVEETIFDRILRTQDAQPAGSANWQKRLSDGISSRI